jgi:hypothetical protein
VRFIDYDWRINSTDTVGVSKWGDVIYN